MTQTAPAHTRAIARASIVALLLGVLVAALLPPSAHAGAQPADRDPSPALAPRDHDPEALQAVLDEAAGSGRLIAGELLVTTAEGTSAQTFAAASPRAVGLRDLSAVGDRLAVARVDAARAGTVAAHLASLPGVIAVEPNLRREWHIAPDDTSYGGQWAHQQTNIEAAWDLSTGGGQAIVAVLDSGVDATHPDLSDNIVAQFQSANGEVVTGQQVNDECGIGHGTAVAGVVGAVGNNAYGLSGVLWDVQIIDVALTSQLNGCPGGPSDLDTIVAMEYVTDLPVDNPSGPSRPDVINMSLGAVDVACSEAYQAAIDAARAAGIVVVSSSGNAGNTATSVPASCNGTISVGATGPNGEQAPYSQTNQHVDVAAPGGCFTPDSVPANGCTDQPNACPSGFANLIAQTVATTSLTELTTPIGGCAQFSDPNGHRLQGITGTSFSSPYVAAVAALAMEYARSLPGFAQGGGLTPDQVEAAIENTAREAGSAGRDNAFGWGVIDVAAAMIAVRDGTIGNLQPDPDFPVGQGGPTPTPGVSCPEPPAPPVGVDWRRIADSSDLTTTDPVLQAIAVSCGLPDGAAPYAVLARVDDFADALAGSAVGFGLGPLLYTSQTGPLDVRTEAELLRVLSFGGQNPPAVFIMGGTAAIPSSVDDRLMQLGIQPVRVAGAGREATAVAASQLVEAIRGAQNFTTRDYAFVVYGRNFADAVSAGQMAAYYGIPILATNTEPPLHPDTRAELQRLNPGQVYVVGGSAVVSDAVVNEIAAMGLATERLAGSTRVDTGIEVARQFLTDLQADGDGTFESAVTVAVNVRSNFNDVLSATLVAGNGNVFLPLEGPSTDPSVPELTQSTRDFFCGFGGGLLIAGGQDVISDAAANRAQEVLDATAC